MKFSKRDKKIFSFLALILLISCFSVLSFAASTNTNVAGAVQTAFGTYMKPQIKAFANGVLLPIIDAILLLVGIVKAIMSGIAYKHQGGQYDWHSLAIVFCGLIVSISAPFWIWNIIGW